MSDAPATPRRLAPCIMVWGTASGVGKSWLVTALCRHYARQGLRVAPFKAQNMSNNARVVPLRPLVRVGAGEQDDIRPRTDRAADAQTWGEIGTAQYLQALAAGTPPDVRMNPVLLKPESDTRSQVVVWGRVDNALAAVPWRERSALVWPRVAVALDSLREEHDLVVMEGAGSPAEINLAASDYVNLRAAEHADARAILVADIDRGGAFAHLHGTWALLPAAQRARLRGFVLNKFRGDAALLAPGPQLLQSMTGVPTVATLPMWRGHGLPEEDAWFDLAASSAQSDPCARTLAIVAAPRISNLDEFEPLRQLPGLRLVWARCPADLAGATWVVLPGSKHTSSDLAWLRSQGLDAAIAAHAAGGGALLGICAGLQMLGEALVDSHGIDGNAPGLGLLPLVTQFAPVKTLARSHAQFADGPWTEGPWGALAGLRVDGYEIHHGQTMRHPAMLALGHRAHDALFAVGSPTSGVDPAASTLGWCNARGNILGIYLHGLFETPAVLQALFGAAAPAGPGGLHAAFEGLADAVAGHFSAEFLENLIK